MIPSLRHAFNSAWTPAKHSEFLRLLQEHFGEPVPFRHSETPCFLPAALVNKAITAGLEIVAQLLSQPDYLESARKAIPARYLAPNEAAAPLFVQADFGLDSEQRLHLVEIQGFPSLYGYQPILANAYRDTYAIPGELTDLPAGLTSTAYTTLLRSAILGNHNAENVALLEIDPWNQKTRHDFKATQEMLGISVVDARNVVKRNRQLFYSQSGKEIPIRRIYNRVIGDEVERRGIELPFSFSDDLNVEWAGHPNWFFLLSKFSLPFVRHDAVPRTVFLNEADDIENPSGYVLKPLYSFAGAGVIVGPTAEQIAGIAPSDRHNYILQERIDFAPCIATPDGPTKIEIRVMYIWLDELRPVNLVIRMGRGAQMGVDHNKGFGWVGASAAFIQGKTDDTALPGRLRKRP